MINSKAYMAGFCKAAEDAGVDPVELMKYAGLWDSIKGGVNKVTGAIGNGVKAVGNAVANSSLGQGMKQMGSSIANSGFGQGMKQWGQGMMGFGKNMMQGNFGAAMDSYRNAAKGGLGAVGIDPSRMGKNLARLGRKAMGAVTGAGGMAQGGAGAAMGAMKGMGGMAGGAAARLAGGAAGAGGPGNQMRSYLNSIQSSLNKISPQQAGG